MTDPARMWSDAVADDLDAERRTRRDLFDRHVWFVREAQVFRAELRRSEFLASHPDAWAVLGRFDEAIAQAVARLSE